MIYNFWVFEFLIFKYSDIGLLWSKITIFIIEITLKQLLHTKYIWNNPNSRRLGLKSPKFNFLLFLAAQKFIAHKHSNTSHGLNFHHKLIFLMLITISYIRINNNWNYQNMLIIYRTIPLGDWMIKKNHIIFTWEKNILNKTYVSCSSKHSLFRDFFWET